MDKLASRAIRAALLCMVGLLVPTAGASPVTFTITGGSWVLGSGWGPACTSVACDAGHTALNADWTIDPSLAQSFTLGAAGDTFKVVFGAAKLAAEDNKIDAAEQDGIGVTGVLTLSAPASGGESHVAVVVATSGATDDRFVDLDVAFAPVTVGFGAGGEFSVDFSDSAWDCNGHKLCQSENPDTRTITASFTLMRAPGSVPDSGPFATVPEPATLALLGIAIAGLGFSRRKG